MGVSITDLVCRGIKFEDGHLWNVVQHVEHKWQKDTGFNKHVVIMITKPNQTDYNYAQNQTKL